MSYLFPRRVLRAQDVLDPIELTQDISPAAERLSGRLNAHNFNQTIASTVAIADEAFYKPYFAEVAADPQFSGPPTGPYQLPLMPGAPGADPDAYKVSNTFEWQTIDDANAVALGVSLSTGGSVLWISAYAQYFWNGFNNGVSIYGGSPWGHDFAGPSTRPCNVQFAIRVDGAVVAETITGIDQIDFRSSLALKAASPRQAGTFLPGPQDIRGNVAAGLGPACLPVRITYCLPVQAGDHTVELVVRRLPDVRDSSGDLAYSPYDFVAVFNRQLLVVDLKSFPTDSVAGAEVSAPAWDEEDQVTTASIYTQRVQPVINGYNAVQAGNVQRGAFMHYHLPTALIAANKAEFDWGTQELFNSGYPGPTMSSVLESTTKYAGIPGVGWYLLNDGSAPTRPIQTGPFDATRRSFFLVYANAQLVRVSKDDLDNLTLGMQNQFAAFKIMYKVVGDPVLKSLDASTGYINSFVSFTRSTAAGGFSTVQATERAEVQLMACLDLRAAPLAAQIEYFALYGAAITEPTPASAFDFAYFVIRRADIVVLQMRP